MRRRLEIGVFAFIWQRDGIRFLELFLVVSNEAGVDFDVGWHQGRRTDKNALGVSSQFADQVQERLFEIVVGLGRDVIVLNVQTCRDTHTYTHSPHNVEYKNLKNGKLESKNVK
jgi:hypothetical protein